MLQDGEIQYDEFCSRLRCEPTLLLHTLFSFFASPGQSALNNPKLNFAEFTLFVTYFLTLNERGLVEFLFVLLTCGESDRTEVASIPFEQLQTTMHQMIPSIDSRKLAAFLSGISDNKKGKLYVTQSNFTDAVMTHNKSSVFPFVAYQLGMTKKVVNRGFWSQRFIPNKSNILSLRNELQKLLRRERSNNNEVAGEDDISLSMDG